jgi:hypothetical protein
MLDAIGIHNMNFYAFGDLACSVGLRNRSSVFIIANSVHSVLRTLHRTETDVTMKCACLGMVYVAVNDCNGERSITFGAEEMPLSDQRKMTLVGWECHYQNLQSTM